MFLVCVYDRTEGALETRYGYTGREHEAVGTLVYFRSRYFNTKLGRFLSDDIDYLDGLSLPAGYFAMWGGVDPSGRSGGQAGIGPPTYPTYVLRWLNSYSAEPAHPEARMAIPLREAFDRAKIRVKMFADPVAHWCWDANKVIYEKLDASSHENNEGVDVWRNEATSAVVVDQWTMGYSSELTPQVETQERYVKWQIIGLQMADLYSITFKLTIRVTCPCGLDGKKHSKVVKEQGKSDVYRKPGSQRKTDSYQRNFLTGTSIVPRGSSDISSHAEELPMAN